jgi:hypothetical protein
MVAPAEPISAADLVVLLYRADWTRLSLPPSCRSRRTDRLVTQTPGPE